MAELITHWFVMMSIHTVAVEAVGTSFTAFVPLVFVTGSRVLNAGFAVVLAPAEVALSKAWGSGNVAFDAVSASLSTLFLVARVWATFIGAVSARHAVLLAPSEIAGFHAWVKSSVALKAVGAFISA
jgi:hypothetical protein